MQGSIWVLSDCWGTGQWDQPANTGNHLPSTLVTQTHTSPDRLDHYSPFFTPSLYGNYTPHTWLVGSATWVGLANGRWVVVMLVGSCVRCACSWLALLCSCDPLWEELVPQSHCPFSLSLRVNLHGTNLPEAWSPTWPSLRQPSQEHEKRDLFLYAIEILRYFITRQNLTNAPLLVRLWENYLSHHPG